ncbi:MAG: efflux RND transporter permease subunit [Pseudomonadales bacterium]
MTNANNVPSQEHSEFHDVVESSAENVVFNYRVIWLILIAFVSVFLGYHAVQIKLETGFQKMIPKDHLFINNYKKHQQYVQSPNMVRIIVESKQGNIFDETYLETLQKINDETFFISGVDRAAMKSMWTKNVQWKAVTEEGFSGGVVIPDDYDGSPASLLQVRINTMRSGEVGNLVANDYKSSVIYAPLLDFDPATGNALDYAKLSEILEDIRARYNAEGVVNIRIIGFAKVVGNMIDAIGVVGLFFGCAVGLTLILLYWYTGCIRATVPPLFCALLAIVWQLGLLRMLGFGLDPFSILVPFLVFAIGVSHAVQNVNYMAIAASKGAGKMASAKQSFRSVFAPGLTALISDGVGFFTIYVIPVLIVQELAIAASVGIFALVFSKLVLLPLLMSYIGISQRGIDRAKKRQNHISTTARFLTKFTRRSWALPMIMLAVVIMGVSVFERHRLLKVGDLDKGAPEFHPDSVYNQDVAYVVDNYSNSSDVMIIMVESVVDGCSSRATLDSIDRFHRAMENVDGVSAVASSASGSKRMAALLNEGNIRWATLYRDQRALNGTAVYLPQDVFFNMDKCNLSFVYLFLADHKAATLDRVAAEADRYSQAFSVEGVTYLLAAGNAGIEAATNDVIKSKQNFMLVLVYTVVTLMVLVTFRNLRSVICIMVPLSITSMLCEAVMGHLGIGIKVATLPVIALGVGIGVDYGIYIYSRLEHYIAMGKTLEDAYLYTMMSAGRAVMFTGLTLSAGVMTWIFSPLKFQADMGILLTFMFVWNMVGAMVLLPALASYLFKESTPSLNQRPNTD